MLNLIYSKARKQNIGSSKKDLDCSAEIGKLTDKQFLKYEKDIDQAYKDGRVKGQNFYYIFELKTFK